MLASLASLKRAGGSGGWPYDCEDEQGDGEEESHAGGVPDVPRPGHTARRASISSAFPRMRGLRFPHARREAMAAAMTKHLDQNEGAPEKRVAASLRNELEIDRLKNGLRLNLAKL